MFRLFADNVLDYALFVIDADRTVRTWGHGAERLLGYTEAEILGERADVFFTPEDIAAGQPEEEVRQALAEGRGEDDRWHVRKDGTRFWSAGVLTPLRDGDGRLHGFCKVMRDQTALHEAEQARREAEAALRESEGRLRFTLDATQVGQWDLDLVTGRADRTLRHDEIFGYASLLPEWTYDLFLNRHVHPDDRAAVDRAFKEATASGREWEFECRVARADGEARWIWAKGGVYLRDGGGRPLRMLGLVTDITARKRAEEEQGASEGRLRGSEALKAALLETALDGVVTIDHEDRIAEFNPAAERIFGHRRTDVLGRPMAELLVPPSLREAHYAGMARYLATGVGPVLNRRIEVTALRADGSEVPIELAIVPTASAPPLFTAHVRDISERHERDRRRAVRLEVTQILAETGPFGEAVVRRLRAVCEGLGWQVGNLWVVDRDGAADGDDPVLRLRQTWRTADAACPRFEAASRTTVFRRGEGLPGRVWEEGRPLTIQDVADDALFPRARLAAEEGLHGAIAFPVVAKGEVAGVVEFFRREVRAADDDLLETFASVGTQVGQFFERRRAEEELRESEERFRATFDQAAVGVALVGMDNRTQWVNPGLRSMLGYAEEEMREKTFVDVTHPDDLETDFKMMRRLLTGETPSCRFDKRYLHKDGSVVWGDLTVTLVRAADGTPKYGVAVVVDITDRRRAEDELVEANRRKDEFLAMLAHELRNPLAPIRSGLDLLKISEVEPDVVDLMSGQVGHLVRLVDDLLDVSRILRGRVELKRQTVGLSDVVRRAVETVRPMVEAEGQVLSVSLPDGPVWLDADPVRLTQVVSNLLNNASKYTEPGGRIALSAVREDGGAVVRVSDTGIGIDAALLPHVFDLFTQSERTIDRSQGGLGIGLTVVKNLVEMHGGNVSVRSEGPGKGSEFAVRLPVVETAASVAGGDGDGPAADGRSILVVDDNVPGAKLLGRLLEKLGRHRVHLVHDGEAALEAVERLRPDLVLLDIGLPKLDGYEVARRLRERSEFRDVLLVALTGYGTAEDRRRSIEAGFDDHLTKPPGVDLLRKVLAHPKLKRP